MSKQFMNIKVKNPEAKMADVVCVMEKGVEQ
jgi:hypothetical protein